MAAALNPDILKKAINERISGIQHVEVEDQSGGCGAKFSVIVVANSFEGISLLDRQRLVHAALKEEMKHIHALSMKTWTPKQWQEKQNQPQA